MFIATIQRMEKKARPSTRKVVNRRARHEYTLNDSLIVGISLSGPETKALRIGHGQFQGAYVTIKDNELWLINANITGNSNLPISETEQTRSRKLLAKRREINKLIEAKQQGMTIVPLELLTGGRYIKLRIALGRGKKHYDKRAALKARDEQRRIQGVLKRQ